MKAIAVFVKKEESGILVPCRVFPAPDGATWQCGVCGTHPLLRASFGVMSGLWRCSCGAEVELMVDGQPVAIEDVAQVIPAPADVTHVTNVPAKPKRKRQRKLKDEDFLRECGIAIPEEQ
jgi:hypothetical protein